MSKRLFILGSLLETHPRRAPTEARMWTLMVVEVQIGAERRGATSRGPIWRAIRPLAEQGLNEALGFAIGLRPVRPREAVTHGPPATHRAKGVRAIRHRIVGEQADDPYTAPTKPGQRPLQKRRARRRVRGGQDLGIGEPRRVIDRDVQILPAHPPRPAPPVAVDPVANAGDAP